MMPEDYREDLENLIACALEAGATTQELRDMVDLEAERIAYHYAELERERRTK